MTELKCVSQTKNQVVQIIFTDQVLFYYSVDFRRSPRVLRRHAVRFMPYFMF